MTVAMAALVPGALPARRDDDPAPAAISRIPVWSLLLLGAAALAISVAGVQDDGRRDGRSAGRGRGAGGMFPGCRPPGRGRRCCLAAAFGPGPLKWMYVTVGLLMAATMVDMYVPLFGQRLANMAPVVAGFLGAVLAVGWTVSEIASASVNRTRVDRPVRGRRAAGHGDRPRLGRRRAG